MSWLLISLQFSMTDFCGKETKLFFSKFWKPWHPLKVLFILEQCTPFMVATFFTMLCGSVQQTYSHYTLYIKERFRYAHVVFDGYGVPSTKDEEQFQRSCSRKSHTSFHVTAEVPEKNKKQDMVHCSSLTWKLLVMRFTKHHRLIITTAIRIGESEVKSALIGKDPALLILLIALTNPEVNNQMLSVNKAHPAKAYSSKNLQSVMGE